MRSERIPQTEPKEAVDTLLWIIPNKSQTSLKYLASYFVDNSFISAYEPRKGEILSSNLRYYSVDQRAGNLIDKIIKRDDIVAMVAIDDPLGIRPKKLLQKLDRAEANNMLTRQEVDRIMVSYTTNRLAVLQDSLNAWDNDIFIRAQFNNDKSYLTTLLSRAKIAVEGITQLQKEIPNRTRLIPIKKTEKMKFIETAINEELKTSSLR